MPLYNFGWCVFMKILKAEFSTIYTYEILKRIGWIVFSLVALYFPPLIPSKSLYKYLGMLAIFCIILQSCSSSYSIIHSWVNSHYCCLHGGIKPNEVSTGGTNLTHSFRESLVMDSGYIQKEVHMHATSELSSEVLSTTPLCDQNFIMSIIL